MSLKYYEKEAQEFSDMDHKAMSPQDVQLLNSRLSRHFSVPIIKVIHRKKAGWSFFQYQDTLPYIQLAAKSSCLTFVHEFAHYLDFLARKQQEQQVIIQLKKMGRLDFWQRQYYIGPIWRRHWHSKKHAHLVKTCISLVKSWGYVP